MQPLNCFLALADDGMSICTCWQLLQSITGVASGGTDGTADLLRGAQEYLERGHVAYMQRAIQAERAQVITDSVSFLAHCSMRRLKLKDSTCYKPMRTWFQQ